MLLSSPNSGYVIQSQFHTRLTDFLDSHSQRVAGSGILSSPLLKAGVLHGSVLGPEKLLIFIYDLADALENPLNQFADDSTLSSFR